MAMSGTEARGTYHIQGLCNGYVREYPHKILYYMVQYLHFRILKFPLVIWQLFYYHNYVFKTIVTLYTN